MAMPQSRRRRLDMKAVAVVLGVGVLLAGCSLGSESIDRGQTSEPSTSVTPQTAGTPSPSETDESRLEELMALRSIDPCGFVDTQGLSAIPGLQSFTCGWADDSSYVPRAPRGLERCVFRFADENADTAADLTKVELLSNPPGLVRRMRGPVALTVDEVNVYSCAPEAGVCNYYLEIPVDGLRGSPAGMSRPMLIVTSERVDADSIARTVATIAAKRLSAGVPIRGEQVRLARQDPCDSIRDLAGGNPQFDWAEPEDGAQYPYTWRTPYHCSIRPTKDPDPLKRNIINVDFGLWKQVPADTGQWQKRSADGTEYWVEAGGASGCHIVVPVGSPVQAHVVPDGSESAMDQRIPIVEVQTYSAQCEPAEQIGLKAAKRAMS